jgi:VCBS repeat-containing protein
MEENDERRNQFITFGMGNGRPDPRFATLPPQQAANVLSTTSLKINGLTLPSAYLNADGKQEHHKGGHSSLMSLDLGLRYNFILNDDAKKTANNSQASLLTEQENGWSIQNAVNWSGRLTETQNRGEKAALRNFLSLYSLTVDDQTPTLLNGGWEDIRVRNGDAVKRAIFGNGSQAASMIQNVFLGQSGFNEYRRMNAILKALDIDSKNSGGGHWHHFHVDFKTPQRVALPTAPARLEASSDVGSEVQTSTAENSLEQALQDLIGENQMDAYDFASLNANQIAIIAKADSSSNAKQRAIGVCSVIQLQEASTPIGPENQAYDYFVLFEQKTLNEKEKIAPVLLPTSDALRLTKMPQNGMLEIKYQKDLKERMWHYTPKAGFVGKDTAEFEVPIMGTTVRVRYVFEVTKLWINHNEADHLCKKVQWKISQSGEPDPSSTDYAAWQRSANLSALIASAQSTLTEFTDLPATALGQTVGEGASAAITLDTNAAGHGWYVDPTPLDNTDEYLPTSQAGVWQAKAGSDAAGKMDMLSVLLHEYGHALGLEHSAEAGDFMNASLQPGMRKLPTAEQLVLMSQLVAQLKAGDADGAAQAGSTHAHTHDHDHEHAGHEHDHNDPNQPDQPGSPLSMLGLLPFGFVRRGSASGSTIGSGSSSATGSSHVAVRTHDYMTAVNATLVNGKFHLGANVDTNGDASGAVNGLQGWESFGAVQATASAAANASEGQTITLMESTGSAGQTRLSQAFTLGARDRFLTFTVTGLDLQNNSLADAPAPQDAFEVALLNANTGLPVMWSASNGAGGSGSAGNTGAVTTGIQTTRSDALLNIQRTSSALDAALAERAAAGVTHIDNPDGSRTYIVNLSGIAANTAVNLSFDLIGFGQTRAQQGSKVGIRDVRLLSTPLAMADTATLAEDSRATINTRANDLNADAPGFSAELVSQATHGQVTLLPDGTLSYQPAANFFGQDSFTYRYTDGSAAGQSEIATVTINVTPVNDAPVASDIAVSTSEDNPVTINLVALDVDSIPANLVFSI